MIPGDPWGAPWGAPWGSVGDPWEVSGESLWVPWEIPEDSLWCPWEGPGDPGAVGLSGLGEGGWGVNPWGLVASGFPTWTNKDHRKHMPQIVSKRFQNELSHPTPACPSTIPIPLAPASTSNSTTLNASVWTISTKTGSETGSKNQPKQLPPTAHYLVDEICMADASSIVL